MRRRANRALRDVLRAARTECALRHDPRVGTDHLLIALLHDPAFAASHLHRRTPNDAREALRMMDEQALSAIGIEVYDMPSELPMPVQDSRRADVSAGAKSALARASRIAAGNGRKHVAPCHLLLALTNAPAPDPAVALITAMGLDPARIAGDLAA